MRYQNISMNPCRSIAFLFHTKMYFCAGMENSAQDLHGGQTTILTLCTKLCYDSRMNSHQRCAACRALVPKGDKKYTSPETAQDGRRRQSRLPDLPLPDIPAVHSAAQPTLFLAGQPRDSDVFFMFRWNAATFKRKACPSTKIQAEEVPAENQSRSHLEK